jgi:hypothetical protein
MGFSIRTPSERHSTETGPLSIAPIANVTMVFASFRYNPL